MMPPLFNKSTFKLLIALLVLSLIAVLVLLAPDLPAPDDDTRDPDGSHSQGPMIVYHSCPSLLYSERKVECGRYFPARDPVREYDRAAADVGRFYLPFAIFRVNEAANKTPLVYIAGGPGDGMQTSLDQLQGWAYWLEEVELEQDLVVYDQRGLLPGEPYWDCHLYDQISRAILAENLSVAAEYARTAPVLETCLKQFDSWLRSPRVGARTGTKSFSSGAAAADLQGLLSALDYQQWDLWGVSYGTRVALVAAQQQPEQVRSMVLDSPYPLDRGESVHKPRIYAQALQRFWRVCTRNQAFCGHDVADLERLFWQAVDWLELHPQTFRVSDAQNEPVQFVLNGQRLLSLTLFSLYDQRLYDDMLESLLMIQRARELGHWPQEETGVETVRFLINSLVTSAFAKSFNTMVFFAIECNDNPLQPAADYQKAVAAQPGLEPYLAPTIERNPCEMPIFDSRGLLSATPMPQIPALILVGELDPVTPVEWARGLAEQLPKSHLIEVPLVSHAVISSGVCDSGLFNDFLSKPAAFNASAPGSC